MFLRLGIKRVHKKLLSVGLCILLLLMIYFTSQGQLDQRTLKQRLYQNGPEVLMINTTIQIPLLQTKHEKGHGSSSLEYRRKVVERVCNEHPELKSHFGPHALVSSKHNFLYCYVPKVACTFWGRFFYQLEHSEPMGSPFDISVGKAFGLRDLDFFEKEAGKNRTKFLELIEPMTKFVFVRAPLSRVFSAYVDKMLAPNPIMWEYWAVPAVMSARGLNKDQVKDCGKNVTFTEFVSYVVSALAFQNYHLTPIHTQCPPCSTNYTIIGKMETALADTQRVLDALNIEESQIHLDRMGEDAATFALEDSSKDSLSKAWLKKGCAGKEEVLKRIVRKLQIRGFISWRFKYRISQNDAEDMTLKDFLSVLSSARAASNNKAELSLQKKQAFLEAYRTLSDTQIQQLRTVYKYDVLLYDYEEEFKKVEQFRRGHFVDTQAFNFQNDWDLSALL